ncbi:MAG: fructose-1,6-bisphosphatase [Lachnospiraceae bacterium]|nr:fructose-1,6-bisphosphatase [Lachnospiraceae bacterium]
MKKDTDRYLKVLAKQYPTELDAATEIINLQAILCLPKGTEHFLTDIHGEYEQFNHVLKNGSGAVRRKIEEVEGNAVSNSFKRRLASLIYYPKEKLEIVKKEESDMNDWYMFILHHLVLIIKSVSSKYTRSKVRKAIPKDFVYVIEELITEKAEVYDKEAYYNEIIQTIIRIGEADAVIITLCNLIQRLVIDHLHIVGDIYDRGPGPHIIMDTLCDYHSVDIQWGNHDLVWMGAAAGHYGCLANVIRLSAKYGNLDVLEEGYGINLMPLASFAIKEYGNSDCECFKVKSNDKYDTGVENHIETLMHKAIAIIQFKVEGQIIKRNPEFGMDDRLLLDKIDYKKGTVVIDEKEYQINDIDLPTINPENPYELTKDEKMVLERLGHAFMNSEKLQKHTKFLYSKGGLYKKYNSNLLFHGCIPLDEDGEFSKVNIFGKYYSGIKLYEVLETYARKGYFAKEGTVDRRKGGDILWYLWNGPKSPAFGRNKMSTFERIFISDKSTYIEEKDTYYSLIDDEATVCKIFDEFGLSHDESHIINGHVPVELKKGESPIKCNGKVLVIDGGFSKAYHQKTGIAGYTLVSNSRGMRLVSHEKFDTTEKAITEETDIVSDSCVVEVFKTRKNVGDTDIGAELKENITYLEELLKAYRTGRINQVIRE